MPVRTETTYYIEHEGQEFETQFKPIDYSESWKITVAGNRALVSYLSQDDDANGWYFDENDQGRFISFDPRCMGERLGKEEARELMAEHAGRAFVIHKYEHGLCCYYRPGSKVEAGIPDKRWDVSHGAALFIVPDDVPEPEKYCDSVMEEFTNWCNGEIYGICHATYNKCSKDGEEWEWVEDQTDECWGYIGSEYADKELDEQHQGRLKDLEG